MDLFKSGGSCTMEQVLNLIPYCVTPEMNAKLTKQVTDKEMLEGFAQMDPRKAPGCDGLSGLFFKENWSVVGPNILKNCNDVLNGDKSVKDVNETMVVLIPKVDEPKDLTNF